MNSSSIQATTTSPQFYDFQQPKKEGLTDKFRQKINAVGKRGPSSRQRNVSEADLSYLTARSQVRYQKKKILFI
jgi:hypothetical protein